MERITPCLWFSDKAEEAANFYVSLFPDSRIDRIIKSPLDTPGGKKGDVMLVQFTLAGRPFAALNGGDAFSFSPAVSLYTLCRDQAEVDRVWDALLDGGKPMVCGWLTDRYGLAWQVVPQAMQDILNGDDTEKMARAMQAMMQMVKFDVAGIEAAAA